MNDPSKNRRTFRQQVCLGLLKKNPCFVSELRWKTWHSELINEKTKSVCPKSTNYRTSFNRSLKRWESLNLLNTTYLDTIGREATYGMASQIAIYSLLERGQLSPYFPLDKLTLYFGRYWCSVVIDLGNSHAANLGAVNIVLAQRYEVASEKPIDPYTDLSHLSEVDWILKDAVTGHRIAPSESLKIVFPPKRHYYSEPIRDERESSTREGVALAVKHQHPGGISPFMLPGEQVTGVRFDSQNG